MGNRPWRTESRAGAGQAKRNICWAAKRSFAGVNRISRKMHSAVRIESRLFICSCFVYSKVRRPDSAGPSFSQPQRSCHRASITTKVVMLRGCRMSVWQRARTPLLGIALINLRCILFFGGAFCEKDGSWVVYTVFCESKRRRLALCLQKKRFSCTSADYVRAESKASSRGPCHGFAGG